MSTTVLHSKVQHSRFLNHLAASIAAAFAPVRPRAVAPAHRANAHDDARKVREMAYRVADSDPGFAADLYAAAARHESLGD